MAVELPFGCKKVAILAKSKLIVAVAANPPLTTRLIVLLLIIKGLTNKFTSYPRDA